MDSEKTIKNINIDSESVTIDGKPLEQFIADAVVHGIRKYHNPDYDKYVLYDHALSEDEVFQMYMNQLTKEDIEQIIQKEPKFKK